MKTKKFDCVEMKRQGADRVRQRVAGMSLEQEIEYWRKCSEEFERDQQRRRATGGDIDVTKSVQE
jgi:hypothetical protein